MLASEREGGDSAEAINISQQRGYCLEEDLPSDSYESSNLGNILKHLSLYDREFRSDTIGNESQGLLVAESICESFGNSIQDVFGNISVRDIANIMTSSHQLGLLNGLKELSCKKRVAIEGKVLDLPQQGRIDSIDSHLESGGIVGIDYQINALGLNSGANQTVGLHASTVVGRRWHEESGKCEYLIRNSWGESCVHYQNPDRCENGNIWVDRDSLKNNLTGAYIFE